MCASSPMCFSLYVHARATRIYRSIIRLFPSLRTPVFPSVSPLLVRSRFCSLSSLSLSLSLSLLLFVRRRFCLYAGNIRDAGRERERERVTGGEFTGDGDTWGPWGGLEWRRVSHRRQVMIFRAHYEIFEMICRDCAF